MSRKDTTCYREGGLLHSERQKLLIDRQAREPTSVAAKIDNFTVLERELEKVIGTGLRPSMSMSCWV